VKPAIVAHEGRHDELARQLRTLAAQVAARAGVELVDFRVAGSSSARRIRVDVDRAGPASVTHEDCRIVSSTLGAAIDEAGIITGNYTLEISSPGVDRLIRTPDDVRRNVGRRIIVQTNMAVDGREEFVGVLRGFVDEALCIDDDAAGAVRIPLDSVAVARQEVAF
jgi:ribosome maturation factor RimP